MGGGFYWIELVPVRSYDGDVERFTRLFRYDLATGRAEAVRDNIGSPLVAVGRDLLGLRLADKSEVVKVDRNGWVQGLTPDTLDVIDFEPADEHTIVFIADGVGPRAIFKLDLFNPRPTYVADADVLLDVSDGRVFALTGDDGFAIDLGSGARTAFKPPKHIFPVGHVMLEVEQSSVTAYDMLDGKTRPVAPRAGKWRLLYSSGTVLARTPATDNRSDAFLVKPTELEELPTLLGGTTLLGVTTVGQDRWALVGQNTINYSGDLADTASEADICLLPTTPTVTFPARFVPKRYLEKAKVLFDNAGTIDKKSTLQLFEDEGAPVTLELRVAERAGSDFEVMRKRALEVDRTLTELLDDHEIRTQVRFRDERVAIRRWRRARMRERTFVGMGDIHLSDPSELDVELRDRSDSMNEHKIHCSGTVVNTRPMPQDALSVRCIYGDRKRVIDVPVLAPGATFAFDQTYEVGNDASPVIEIARRGEAIEFYDTKFEQRTQQEFELAAKIYDDTGLALDWHRTDDRFVVAVKSVASYETLSEDQRLRLAQQAYKAFEGLRSLEPVPDDAKLVLRIDLFESPTYYEFDGSKLKTFD
jgi:hypothetical protein